MSTADDGSLRVSEPPAPARRKLPPDVRAGRAMFFVFGATYLVWELTVLVLQWVNASPLVAQSAVRTLGGLVLFLFAWRGRAWAHVLLGLAFGIFFVAAWATALGNAYGPGVGALLATAGSWFGIGGAMLSFERRFRAYFAHQREHD